MAIRSYTPQERYELADKVGLSEQYLYQVLTGRRIPSGLIAVRINKADKRLRLQDLRPNDYWLIWPNLEPKKKAA